MSRQAILVVLILALAPAKASSQDPVIKDGDPGFHWGFPGSVNMFRGETRCYELAPANYGFISSCGAEDTFCVQVWNDLGWPMTNEFDGEVIILDAGYLQPGDVCITVPCEASAGTVVLAFAIMAYVDVSGVCRPDSGDCEDPNVFSGIPRWQVDTLEITVVDSPPALYILQDTLYYVEDLQSQAYVPFSICNGDPCGAPADFEYIIRKTGIVGGPNVQTGTASGVPGGECADVYCIVDATVANVWDWDSLTITAWDAATGTEYDTCVQVIYVIENCCVPLLGARAIAVLALLLISAAALMLRRRLA